MPIITQGGFPVYHAPGPVRTALGLPVFVGWCRGLAVLSQRAVVFTAFLVVILELKRESARYG